MRPQKATIIVPALAVIVALTTACSEMIGKRATEGSVTAIREAAQEVDPSVPGPLAERASRGVVTGTLMQLAEPAQKAAFQEAVAAASTSAMSALAGTMRQNRTLGDMQVATRALSASAIQGVRDQLHDTFPECTGPERSTCVAEKVGEISRAAVRGMTKGIFDDLEVIGFVLSFALGALLTAVMVGLLRRPVRVVEKAA